MSLGRDDSEPIRQGRTSAVFFLGKGGVGKTSLSLASALAFDALGIPVAVVSLDQAHNLLDLAGFRSGPGRRQRIGAVELVEVDLSEVLDVEVRRARSGIDAAYGHLRSLGLDSVLDLVGRSPGMIETAVLSHLDGIRTQPMGKARLVLVDMPPTAQAGRILDLAGLTRRWLEQLQELRRRIVSLRDSVGRLRGARARGPDKILGRIESLLERYRAMEQWIERDCASVIVAGSAQVTVREAEIAAARPSARRLLVWNKGRFSGNLPSTLRRIEQVSIADLGPNPSLDRLASAGRPLAGQLALMLGLDSDMPESEKS